MIDSNTVCVTLEGTIGAPGESGDIPEIAIPEVLP
jgi:hypothetical protein